MTYKFNPFTGNLDVAGDSGPTGPAGADGDGTAYYGQISRQASGTVAVAAAETYYPIDLPGTFDTANSYGMVSGTSEDLALKNDSGEPQLFTVIGSADVRSANNQVLGLRLAVDGTPIAASECRVTTGSTNYGKLLSQWIIELADGEEVSLHVANFTGTTTITVDRAKLVAFTAGRQGEKGDQGDPGAPGADAPDTLDGLTDVVITDPAEGEVLVYDGSEWVNDTAPGGSATPAGAAGEIQINDGEDPAGLGAVAGFGYDTATDVLSVPGDINLDDGGDYETTLQLVTPTANRTISFPDNTGTVALVAGVTTEAAYSSLQGGFTGAVPFVWDNALSVDNGIGFNPSTGILSVRGGFTTSGAFSSIATLTGNTTFNGRIINSFSNAASAPAGSFTGTWFTAGTSTTTKPSLLVEQSGATSTGWNATGTGFGVNSASTFAGRLLDLQKNGTTVFNVLHTGDLQAKGDLNLDDGGSFTTTLQTVTATANRTISFPDATGTIGLVSGSTGQLIFNDAGAYAGVSTATVSSGNITLTGRLINSTAGALSASPVRLDGTWLVSGGANNTTFPQLYISPSGASTGTSWSTAGTGLGINAPASFTGDLIHLLINGTTEWKLSNSAFTIGDANDIAVGTTTGTKIGTATTQKLAFYNATPVVQPTAVADATNEAEAVTQLNALLTRLRDLGIIAT